MGAEAVYLVAWTVSWTASMTPPRHLPRDQCVDWRSELQPQREAHAPCGRHRVQGSSAPSSSSTISSRAPSAFAQLGATRTREAQRTTSQPTHMRGNTGRPASMVK